MTEEEKRAVNDELGRMRSLALSLAVFVAVLATIVCVGGYFFIQDLEDQLLKNQLGGCQRGQVISNRLNYLGELDPNYIPVPVVVDCESLINR